MHNLFHKLESENIYFKELDINDAEEIHNYISDEVVSRFIGWPLTNTVEETSNFIDKLTKRELEGTHIYASVGLKESNKIIGNVMLFDFDKDAKHAEVGYVIHRDYWGKGYGTEAVALMTKFALETLKLHKLYARVVDANIGSSRILEKDGFHLEGRLKEHFFIENKYYDCLYFAKFE